MQEDKVHLFQAMDTLLPSVKLTNLMLKSADWKVARMSAALIGDFSNATELADDLVHKGLAFREAHEVVGRAVKHCLAKGLRLEDLGARELNDLHPLLDESSVQALKHSQALNARKSFGGTSPSAVEVQLDLARNQSSSV
jgi:argininosuccinate lyase